MAYWKGEPSPGDITTLQNDVAALEAAPKPTLFWGTQDVGAGADSRFVEPGWETAVSSSSVQKAHRVPTAGVLRNLSVKHNAGPGAAEDIVYTIHVNGSPTSLAVTLAADSAGAGVDSSNSAAISAGDIVELIVSKANNVTDGAVKMTAIVEMHPA